jgi:hypothetical protein
VGRHHWTNRLTVEDCQFVLEVLEFHRAGTLASAHGTISTLRWTTIPGGVFLGRLECRVEHGGLTGLALYIRGQCLRLNVIVEPQVIPVGTVRPHLGGKRFWFVCGCGRRIGRLYLPPGQRAFRCRHCNSLTYRSAQTHDQRLYNLARNPAALQLALGAWKCGDWKRVRFGLKAYGLLLARHKRQHRRRRQDASPDIIPALMEVAKLPAWC